MAAFLVCTIEKKALSCIKLLFHTLSWLQKKLNQKFSVGVGPNITNFNPNSALDFIRMNI